jgi:hypothetical protein
MTAHGNALGTVVLTRFAALRGRNIMLIDGGKKGLTIPARVPRDYAYRCRK